MTGRGRRRHVTAGPLGGAQHAWPGIQPTRQDLELLLALLYKAKTSLLLSHELEPAAKAATADG